MISHAEPLALTGIVVNEVLQGLTRDAARIAALFRDFDLLEPSGISSYERAADIIRRGRSAGARLTTVDALIAAVAIEHNAVLFTLGRDFEQVARLCPLRVYDVS
jgi:predicted nucleic acid-binding protein